MRVVHVIASFEIGGAEQLALALAAAQQRAGLDPLLLGLAPGPLTEAACDLRLGCMVLHKQPRFDASLVLRMAALLRDEGASVVHSHNPMALVYTASGARLARVPAVHTEHGEARDIQRRMRLLSVVGRLVGAFVCVSEATRSAAEHTGEAPAERLSVISSNGIDVTRYAPDPGRRAATRRSLGLTEPTFVIGTVGRLNAVKNQALMLRAAAPLLRADTARLLLVGDGPERASLERLAAELGCAPRVIFAGARSDVPELLNAMDVFVLSSDTEGLPLSMLEAMAVELPVVSTDVGGIAAVLGQDVGRLVPAGDEGGLTGALAALRDQAELRRALGQAGRQQVCAHHSLERMHRDYLDVYRAVGAH